MRRKKRSKRLQAQIQYVMMKIPCGYLLVYMYWLEGKSPIEIKELLGKGKRTSAGDRRFQRAAKHLRENHDVELKKPCPYAIPPKKRSNVIPFIRTLIAEPCSPPAWFFEKGLMYNPSEKGLRVVK